MQCGSVTAASAAGHLTGRPEAFPAATQRLDQQHAGIHASHLNVDRTQLRREIGVLGHYDFEVHCRAPLVTGVGLVELGVRGRDRPSFARIFLLELPQSRDPVMRAMWREMIIMGGQQRPVRIGSLDDTPDLVARSLGVQHLLICGAPQYLAARGTPMSPADLAKHHCIVGRRHAHHVAWLLKQPDGTVAPHVIPVKHEIGKSTRRTRAPANGDEFQDA